MKNQILNKETNSKDQVITSRKPKSTTLNILIAISSAHFINDVIQSVLPAIFPILKNNLQLNFTQIGIIAFVFNAVSSLLQPAIGIYSDRKAKPILLPIGMCFTLVGICLLGFSTSFALTLVAVGLIGLGSATFHPEGSRVAYLAAGTKKGLGQSLYQVGGNIGGSL
jgi:FSR family fosmidomycin resistance protein-like MFS transporter